MVKNKVLVYPNKKLMLISKKIKYMDLELEYIIKNMFKIMYDKDGIGLAAIQIGINLNLIVLDINNSRNKKIVLINPKIINYHGSYLGYEACLSFPGVYVKILRYEYVKVFYINQFGYRCLLEGRNILSRCIQHEIDHLKGVTIFNHVSEIKKKKDI